MSRTDDYRTLLKEREAELADTERRLTTAPTEKAAKFLRAKHARISREIEAINKTIGAQTPKGAS